MDKLRVLVSYRELDEFGTSLISDYRKRSGRRGADSVDIEGFIRDYLGLRIQYKDFATGDMDDVGFYGDGSSSLRIVEEGVMYDWVCPEGTVVVERRLLSDDSAGRRRFTLAHEAAHFILMRHVPLQTVSFFLMPESSGVSGSLEDLERIQNLNEACANRLAASLLMPEPLVRRAMDRFTSGRGISYYGICLLTQEDKLAVTGMADMLGVSYTAMLTRLEELDLMTARPFREYAESALRVGLSM